MTKTEKGLLIDELKETFGNAQYFYVTDASTLTVARINQLRRTCFEKGVEVRMIKNTLAIKALEDHPESRNFKSVFNAFKGQSTVLFATDGKLPATIIKDFRGKDDRPLLKAAYIDSDVFFGDDQLEVLIRLKTKKELVGEIVGLLQSPAKNVVSALKSGGATIAGVLKTLEDRAN